MNPRMNTLRGTALNSMKHTSYSKTPRFASLRPFATSKQDEEKDAKSPQDTDPTLSKSLEEKAKQTAKKLTTAELDEQLRQQMEGRSGDGGEAGVEYEDGKPVAMKRSVKNNMFRLI